MVNKKILFLSGTRADYGKMKSLIKEVEISTEYEAYIYVSGMHLLELYGNTSEEIVKDGYKNIYIAFGLRNMRNMSYDLGDLICNLTGYVEKIKPDMIIVHGDRIDALAGAVVGALHNIIVAHIEGGELSGTIDESIRHTISKLAHVHLVCNEEARTRLIQMGEQKNRIFILGSPDIDIMLSDTLPSIREAKERYEIEFNDFAILMYHPVTTEYDDIADNARKLIDAIIESNRNYIVVYPNNDYGSEYILSEYKRLQDEKVAKRFRIYPSIRFEFFLTLLKNASFMIGNSSAGVREAGVYGIPTIDIGTRQSGRYSMDNVKNIQHVSGETREILVAIDNIGNFKNKTSYYGDGRSTSHFMQILEGDIWNISLQKKFIDIDF